MRRSADSMNPRDRQEETTKKSTKISKVGQLLRSVFHLHFQRKILTDKKLHGQLTHQNSSRKYSVNCRFLASVCVETMMLEISPHLIVLVVTNQTLVMTSSASGAVEHILLF